jgi:hypothetical protein
MFANIRARIILEVSTIAGKVAYFLEGTEKVLKKRRRLFKL